MATEKMRLAEFGGGGFGEVEGRGVDGFVGFDVGEEAVAGASEEGAFDGFEIFSGEADFDSLDCYSWGVFSEMKLPCADQDGVFVDDDALAHAASRELFSSR